MNKTFIFSILALLFSFSALASDPACAFGKDINALQKNERFELRKIGNTFKLSREVDPCNPLLWMTITRVTDTKTGRIYQMNTTHNDQYDGGNTLGWIEDVTDAEDGVDDKPPADLRGAGEVVAEISDSWINCLRDFN